MTIRARAGRAVAVAVAVAVLAGGCSAVIGPRPPQRPLRVQDDCDNSRGPFYVDALGAGGAASVAGLMFLVLGLEYLGSVNDTTPSWDPHSSAPSNSGKLAAIGGVATVATVALFASAVYGLRNAKQCDAARLDLIQASRQQPPPTPPPSP